MRFVHLAALWTLAFVQPLFDLLGKNAAFFVARDNTPGDVLIFAFAWTLIPPLIAYGIVRILGRPALLFFIALFSGGLALQLTKELSGEALVAIPLALAIGAGAALAYARAEPVRTFVSILGVAPVVVLVLLLGFSQVSDVVFPGEQAEATAGAEVGDPTPVVLLIFDELPTTSLMRADRTIDAERYPNFADLAAHSTWYRNATSVADGTYVAVPAILTGVRPQAELPTSHVYPKNLFTLLGRNYTHHVQEPLTSVCPEDLCGVRARPAQAERLRDLAADLSVVERRLLLPDDLADDLPAVDKDFEDFQGDDLADVADEVAERDSPAGQPIRVAGDDLPAQRVRAARAVVSTMEPDDHGLWMVHNVVPHVPWRFLPDGSQYPVLGPTYPGLDDTTWGENRFLLAQAEQRQVLMMRFADRLLGDAISQMRESGLWDDALVIVVADHGGNISAGEERRNVVAKENFAQIAGIPFFVKEPGQADGAVSDAYVTALDVLPTIVEALEVQTDWEFDGLPVDEPRDVEFLQQRNGPRAALVGATPDEFARDFDASLAERLERLPSGLAPVFDVGPRRDLVGSPLSELTLTESGESGFLNNAPLYGEVKRSSGVLPVYVTGATSGVAPGTDLVVAVNGRIEASGEAYVDHGDPRFSMLVKPAALRRGANEIQVLAVDGDTARELVSTP